MEDDRSIEQPQTALATTLCNEWKLDLIDHILSEKIRFRASLGSIVSGRDEFRHYLERVRAAFPDWYHRIDESSPWETAS